jgi:hypothetical protein
VKRFDYRYGHGWGRVSTWMCPVSPEELKDIRKIYKGKITHDAFVGGEGYVIYWNDKEEEVRLK